MNNSNKISFEELRENLIKKGVVDPSGCLNKSCLNGKKIRLKPTNKLCLNFRGVNERKRHCSK